MISMILACDENFGIGKDGRIPWNIRGDLLYFQSITWNRPVIMGRKTFFSLPRRSRPLKNRLNIVLSRHPRNEHGVIWHKDMRDIDMMFLEDNFKEVFVIGGSQIYKQYMPYVSKIYATMVQGNYNCDTYLPENVSAYISSNEPDSGVVGREKKNEPPHRFTKWIVRK